MVTRRQAIIALGVGGFTARAVFAQQLGKVWRIGFLGTAFAAGYAKEIDAIRDELRKLGYVEGRNLAIEFRWAENNADRLGQMAAELVSMKVDVIITHGANGVRAAAQATKMLPIVIADAPDPMALGLVASLDHPGGNITGSTGFQAELAAKRLEMLKEVIPSVKRVVVLTRGRLTTMNFQSLEKAAANMRITLNPVEVNATVELPAAFAAMAKMRPDAVVISEHPLLNSNVGITAALAAAHRLPAVGLATFADAGGLLGYSANRALIYGRSAVFADKIFKGAKPGDLPIERATKFDLVVNLKTAKALGVKIPNSILVRATKVIE